MGDLIYTDSSYMALRRKPSMELVPIWQVTKQIVKAPGPLVFETKALLHFSDFFSVFLNMAPYGSKIFKRLLFQIAFELF